MNEYYLETLEAGIIIISAPTAQAAEQQAAQMGLTIRAINEC